MSQSLLTVVTTALVTGLVQVAAYLFFRRELEKSDQELSRLSLKVDRDQERRIGIIEESVSEARSSRARIHKTVDAVKMDGVTRAECAEHQREIERKMKRIDDTAMKLERVTERTEVLVERVEGIAAEQQATARQLAAVSERIKDVSAL